MGELPACLRECEVGELTITWGERSQRATQKDIHGWGWRAGEAKGLVQLSPARDSSTDTKHPLLLSSD